MRQVILDTETTGLKPEDGHRIVEIGCVELIDKVPTGRTYQVYINPERIMDDENISIHGITNEKAATCPKFKDVVDEFISFIKDAEILAHNSDFDKKFLDAELLRANKGELWSHTKKVTDTMKLAKGVYPKQKNGLDALCTRLGVDNSERTFHGALLDAQLLAEVYIKMNEIHTDLDTEVDVEQKNWVRPEIKRYDPSKLHLVSVDNSQEEEENHKKYLTNLAETNKIEPVWNKSKSRLTI